MVAKDQKEKLERMKDAIGGLVSREGFELVDLELTSDRGRPILRLYIDTIPPGTKEHGVTVDHCSWVSRIVSDHLDTQEDLVDGEYNLEVSSPGLFRPLTKPEHFERAMGERIKVKTFEKLGGRKVFTGNLKGYARDGAGPREATLTVEVDGEDYVVPIAAVAKANLEPEL